MSLACHSLDKTTAVFFDRSGGATSHKIIVSHLPAKGGQGTKQQLAESVYSFESADISETGKYLVVSTGYNTKVWVRENDRHKYVGEITTRRKANRLQVTEDYNQLDAFYEDGTHDSFNMEAMLNHVWNLTTP